MIDVGALVDGYHSDMTRSYVIGDPDPAAVRDLRVLLEIQQAGSKPYARASRPETSTPRAEA